MECSDNEDGEINNVMNSSGRQNPQQPLAAHLGGFQANDLTSSSLFNHYFNLALRQQQKNTPGLDLLGEQFLTNALLSINSHVPNSGLNSSSSHSTEDFCEICQKQFCNKYYLKKHKFDVHGVSTDSPKVKAKISDVSNQPTNVPQPTIASSAKTNIPILPNISSTLKYNNVKFKNWKF